MLRQLDFSKHSISDWKVGLKEMFLEEVTERSRRLVKELLEECIAKEFRGYIQASRYERRERRQDYRNGYRTRALMTTWGAIEDIRVPRSRTNGFQPKTFERYKRVHPRVDEGVLKMFLMGVSTRKVGDVLQSLFDFTVSASYVSQVAKRLDQEVRRYFDRPLEDEFIYLFFDGIFVKVREVSESVTRVVLVCYGIRENGSRELIDFRVGKQETKGAWTSFLQNLRVRGLRGSKLNLITSDGGTGLRAAVGEVFPFVPHQLCWVHKLRNVANKCPRAHRKDCIAHARQIYLSPTVKIAMRVFREWERTWRDKVPRAVKCLAKDIDNLLPFLRCPDPHHRIIRTTNVIERLFRELRRRLKVMSTFSDTASCKRIVYSLFAYHNTRWKRTCYRIKEIACTYRRAA
jgi:putative transposase